VEVEVLEVLLVQQELEVEVLEDTQEREEMVRLTLEVEEVVD
jgi:hypothetical protein